jgi:20S proteasome alpha/beta subunit
VAESATVIAALRYRTGVLIAADSQASDPAAQVRWPITKIKHIRSLPFAMGFSGSTGSGERIFTAMNAATIYPKQLQTRVGLQRVIDGVVKPEYKMASERAYPPRGFDRIAIWGLGAVCTGAEPGILEYEISGESCWHDFFHAIGSGARTAYAIFRTLGGRELSNLGEGTALDALLRIVRTAINVDMAGVSEPIHVWRVDCKSAIEIGEDEINAHLELVAEWEKRDRERLFAADRGEA